MYGNDMFLGFDTSCYTTSAACVCVNGILADSRKLLEVARGQAGLRQSEAVFAHTRNMETMARQLLEGLDCKRIKAVGVSDRPGCRENSYMPVFCVGRTLACAVAAALEVPLMRFSHQQGHVRAALFTNEALIGKPLICIHLSGGTSELLLTDRILNVERLGGTTDINAGQLVDRLGVRLGLDFPSGKSLEALASKARGDSPIKLPASVKKMDCSFSGAETRAKAYIEAGVSAPELALAIYDCIARTLSKQLLNACELTGVSAFLLAGGVASSTILRRMLEKRMRGSKTQLHFARPELASDNAVGTALLCMDEYQRSFEK